VGFEGYHRKILRIKPSEIEGEGDYLIAIYLSDHWKFLRIRPSEVEFQIDFSKFVVNSYIPF